MPTRTQIPTVAEFGAMVAYLQRNGLPISRRRRAVGEGPQGRTMREIVQRLVAELRQSEKAT